MSDRLSFARRLAVMLALIVLSSCHALQRNTHPDALVPGDSALTAGQIPFPDERGASALTEYVLHGAAADLSSAGAVPSGTAMVLSAEVGGYEYALYRFNPTGAGAGAPDSVSVLLEDGATTEAWIGIADYDAGRWSFDGPVTKPKTRAIDDPKYVSPDGNVWVAVLVAAEQSATVNALSVRTIDPANEPPVANFTRTPVLGHAPLTVQFDASTSVDSDGEIIEYAWDFDGDGLYDGFSNDPTAEFTYHTGAEYRPKLRVTDDQGAQSTQDRSMNVNNPPVASLSKTNVGEVVHLDASGSTDADGSITSYEWDLDGDGVFNEAGGEAGFQGSPLAEVTLGAVPGEYFVQVRVTDDKGAMSTAGLTLTIAGWLTLTIDSDGNVGEYTSLSLVNGKPAISYRAFTTFDLKYAYSAAADGSSGWTAIAVDTPGSVGSSTSLAVVNGKPAISYYDSTNQDLKYAYSSTADGSSGWTTIAVDTLGNQGFYTSLAVINGMPAISYRDNNNADLKYAYSTQPDGSSGWTALTIDSIDTVGEFTALAMVNGKPAISYWDITNEDLKYAYSSTADGSLGWTVIAVDAPGSVGQYTSLAVVNGKPAISYFDNPNNDLKYAYSSAADGSSGWSTLTVDAPGNVGRYTSLAVVNGKPAISYWDSTNSDLKYANSSVANGGGGWSTQVVDAPDNVGSYTSLAVLLTGQPAISYYDATNDDLKYAVLYE